jgi:hypothetical protein
MGVALFSGFVILAPVAAVAQFGIPLPFIGVPRFNGGVGGGYRHYSPPSHHSSGSSSSSHDSSSTPEKEKDATQEEASSNGGSHQTGSQNTTAPNPPRTQTSDPTPSGAPTHTTNSAPVFDPSR